VLIFFEDEKLLDNFRRFSGDLGTIPYYITKNKTFDGVEEKIYKDANVNKLIGIEYAGHHGSVTLLTKEFGRGIDFQVDAKVVEEGGLHVIQTFLSIDIKEEVQIKGRTARKDDPGSYELILCLQHLKNTEIKGWKVENPLVSENTTYNELDRFRRAKIDEYCSMKTKKIEENKKLHDKTLEFYMRALSSCHNGNRIEYIKEITNFDQ
jgi:preprotein translocase subunit SecA